MMDDIDRSTDWYLAALKGERGPIDADNPKAGFYRAKARDKTLSAVAIWYDSNTGELRYQDNGRDVDDMKARERWPYVSKKPITEEVFWHFRDTGKWRDIDEAIQPTGADIVRAGMKAMEEAAPLECLSVDILSARDAAAKYTKVESDDEMALAQSVRARLQELGGKADKLRVAEKEPHLEASREVDAKWQPMIKAAKASADALRKAMQDWNDFKLAQAAKAKVSDNAAPNAPPPSVQVSGGGGRAAHVGVKDTVTEIDIDKAFAFFREKPELQQLLLQMAQRSVDAGIDVPGTVVVKKSAIR
jgi:hypothetical protein